MRILGQLSQIKVLFTMLIKEVGIVKEAFKQHYLKWFGSRFSDYCLLIYCMATPKNCFPKVYLFLLSVFFSFRFFSSIIFPIVLIYTFSVSGIVLVAHLFFKSFRAPAFHNLFCSIRVCSGQFFHLNFSFQYTLSHVYSCFVIGDVLLPLETLLLQQKNIL